MIYFLPWGGKELASSRLRVYNALPYMKAKVGVPKKYKKGDVLIIQKKLAKEELIRAQEAGVKVLYDIDDNYLDQEPFVWMCQHADLVTLGSNFFKKYFPNSPVIDDSLDWDGTKKTSKVKTKKVGWVAYGNITYIYYLAPILQSKGYEIRPIVGKDYMQAYPKPYDTKEWSLKTVDKDLAECDFAAYYLPDDDFSQAKGMNKLIKCWAIGIPAFVSPMPEYERVMQEAGVEGYIVKDWNNHDFSLPWLSKMRKYALKFSGKNTAKQWLAAIKQCQSSDSE